MNDTSTWHEKVGPVRQMSVTPLPQWWTICDRPCGIVYLPGSVGGIQTCSDWRRPERLMEYELVETPHAPQVAEIPIEEQPGTPDPAVNPVAERSKDGLGSR